MNLEEEIREVLLLYGSLEIETIMTLVFRRRVDQGKRQTKSTFKRSLCRMNDTYAVRKKSDGKFIWNWRLTRRSLIKMKLDDIKIRFKLIAKMRIK